MRLALIAIVVVACTAKLPALPSKGGEPWLEVTSEHFVMWTDAPPDRARELVNEMEQHRQIVVRAMNNATTTTRALVIAFRNDRELHAYVTWFVGKAFSNTPLLQPMIVVSALTDDDRENTLTHELTHLIAFSLVHHQPRWLAEGFATFFGSAQALDGHVQVGKPRKDYSELITHHQLVPVATMFACDNEACIDHPFYATAWAMFAFLVNEYPDQLGVYLQRLNELPYKRRDEAWAAAFPKLTPEVFDHELKDWIAFGSIKLPEFDVAVRDYPIKASALSDADVLAVRGLASIMLSHDENEARRETTAALAADHANLTAQLVEAALDHKIAAEAARTTAAAHPSDWRAWALVASATTGDERKAARDKACALAKQDPGVDTPERLCE